MQIESRLYSGSGYILCFKDISQFMDQTFIVDNSVKKFIESIDSRIKCKNGNDA